MVTFGEKVIIPKGSKIIVGFDKFAHHISNGMIQSFQEGTEIEEYDSAGLAEYLVRFLKAKFPLADMMEDYEVEDKELLDEIEYALDDIGM